MSAEEAKEFGIVDDVVKNQPAAPKRALKSGLRTGAALCLRLMGR